MTAISRPPIVTIMGHVDHGKTSLLDYIRKTKVAQKEHGGITQHIGAYQVEVKDPQHQSHKITFIDTPGHAAFSQMRSRGGKVADIVILVVAATEGVKPQTKESLDHIKQAQVPYIVALTKSDIATANPTRAKQELAEQGCLVEGFGGDIPVVEVSSVSGKGIDTLLETLLLVAQLTDLKADPKSDISGVIIESQKDPHRGIIATAVITEGTLKVRDTIYAHQAQAKVKSLTDHLGKSLKEALPSTPVQIMGWDSIPQVGAVLSSTSSQETSPNQSRNEPIKPVLTCIIKADAQGSLEAIQTIIPQGVTIFSSTVGDVTPGDISLAKSAGAFIVAFSVLVPNQVIRVAEAEKVTVKSFNIIYELYEYIDELYNRTIDPYYDRDIIGKADINAEFKIDKHRIAGCKVTEGEILDDIQVDLIRNQTNVGTSRISSLKQAKNPVSKVALNQEFGCVFSPYIDFRVGDNLIAFKPKKLPAKSS